MAPSSKDITLVTGASGFLGFHVIDQLVAEGSNVRGTVRPTKVDKIQTDYDAVYGAGRVEIVGMSDLAKGDFTSILQGITSVLHLACPLPDREDPETTFTCAVEGTMNVITQAQKAGVKNFSLASSVGAATNFMDLAAPLSETDWNLVTIEQAIAVGQDPKMAMFTYAAAKARGEKALWDFAEQHPDLNVTTILATYFMGPFAPAQHIPTGDIEALSSNVFIYNLILPDSTTKPTPIGYIDVRDVAACLISGARTPGKNRILVSGEWFEYEDALEYIAESRPELKARLPTIPRAGITKGVIDNARAKEVLGVPLTRPWKQSLLDAVDDVIKVEKEWVEKGVDVENGLKQNKWRSYLM